MGAVKFRKSKTGRPVCRSLMERSRFMDSESRRLITAAVTVVLAGAGLARAAEPTVEELKAQVQELNRKVSALETKQASISSADSAATIDAVLRDADRRTKLMANSADMSAGYDNGFYIRAGDAFL